MGLAGIVIKNGILLIEFTDELRGRGFKTREATIQAGKIRIIPVMLTALATILGLLPLAVGFNIDFVSFFQRLQPHIFFWLRRNKNSREISRRIQIRDVVVHRRI